MASSARLRLAFVVLSLASGSMAGVACGESGDAGGGGSGADGGGGSTSPEAGVGKSDAGPVATTMRLAHVAADLGPVDFCYRTVKSTSFEGPVLGGGIGDPTRDGGADAGDADSGDAGLDADPSDAGAPSVGFRTVSRYFALEASGPLTIALVAPGATSCATPLFTADVTLDPGKLVTVAILGLEANDGGKGDRALVAFIDDRTTAANKARVRMVNAAFGSVSVPAGEGATLAVRAVGAQTLTLAERVEPTKAGSPSATIPVDSLGYAAIDPLPSPAQLAVGAAPETKPDGAVSSWVSDPGELALHGGSLHTGFILTGEGQRPYEILWCLDTSTSGDRTTCERIR